MTLPHVGCHWLQGPALKMLFVDRTPGQAFRPPGSHRDGSEGLALDLRLTTATKALHVHSGSMPQTTCACTTCSEQSSIALHPSRRWCCRLLTRAPNTRRYESCATVPISSGTGRRMNFSDQDDVPFAVSIALHSGLAAGHCAIRSDTVRLTLRATGYTLISEFSSNISWSISQCSTTAPCLLLFFFAPATSRTRITTLRSSPPPLGYGCLSAQ